MSGVKDVDPKHREVLLAATALGRFDLPMLVGHCHLDDVQVRAVLQCYPDFIRPVGDVRDMDGEWEVADTFTLLAALRRGRPSQLRDSAHPGAAEPDATEQGASVGDRLDAAELTLLTCPDEPSTRLRLLRAASAAVLVRQHVTALRGEPADWRSPISTEVMPDHPRLLIRAADLAQADANDRDIPMHDLLTMLTDVAACTVRLPRSEQLDRLLNQFGALISRHLQARADEDSALERPLNLVAQRASALQQASADEVLTAVQAMTSELRDFAHGSIDVSDRTIDLWHASVEQPASLPCTSRQPHPRQVPTPLT